LISVCLFVIVGSNEQLLNLILCKLLMTVLASELVNDLISYLSSKDRLSLIP